MTETGNNSHIKHRALPVPGSTGLVVGDKSNDEATYTQEAT